VILLIGLLLIFGTIVAKLLMKTAPMASHVPVMGGIISWFAGTWYVLPIASFLVVWSITRNFWFSSLVAIIIGALSWVSGGFV